MEYHNRCIDIRTQINSVFQKIYTYNRKYSFVDDNPYGYLLNDTISIS